MAEHKSLPLLLLFFFVPSVSAFAQGPTASGSQTVAPNTVTSSDSNPQPLVTTGQVVAQSIIDAQNANSTTPVIFLQPPAGPTAKEQLDVWIWNNFTNRASDFVSEVWSEAKTHPAIVSFTVVQDVATFWNAVEFIPESVSFPGEILGEGFEPLSLTNQPRELEIPTDLGIGPSLIVGGLTNSSPWSVGADIFGGMSANYLGAATGSNGPPLAWSLYSIGNDINEFANQGAKLINPAPQYQYLLAPEPVLPDINQPSLTPELPQSGDDQVLIRVQQAQQQMADLNAQGQQLNQESVDLANQLRDAQAQGAVLQELDGNAYKASVEQAQNAIARATGTFAPDSGANALLGGPDDGWGLLESLFRRLSLLSAPRQTFDACGNIQKNTIVYNVGCTNAAPPQNVCGPGYAVNPGALAAAQAPWNPYGNQLVPWRDPKYGPLDSSGRVAWCISAKK